MQVSSEVKLVLFADLWRNDSVFHV